MPTNNNLLSASHQLPSSHRVAPTSSDAKSVTADELDTPELRKARGAFFTPSAIVRFMTDWAIRDAGDTVLEPSCGDAEFLVHAAQRLRHLGAERPPVHGVEIHADSAVTARARITNAGGRPDIRVSDFFAIQPVREYTAVVGNPPYIRFRDWAGEARARSRAAATAAGVELSGLASSWAAFTAHSTSFLAPGGRLAFVLPAELLSVGYAAPLRRFLLDSFSSVDLVTFAEQVFAEAEVDVVLLLADGYGEHSAHDLTIREAQNAASLVGDLPGQKWKAVDAAAKWTPALMDAEALVLYSAVATDRGFTELGTWGETMLGTVTGNNSYFALSAARIDELGLQHNDLVPLSPPGSRHLRGLELSADGLNALSLSGKDTWLFHPGGEPSEAARVYIAAGERDGINETYKCRMRNTWWRVPLLKPADLLITCMNADTARITTNSSGARHLNSVHGIYLRDEHRELGRELLPIASLNTVTLLGAETVGRTYGGGILKLEPREAGLLPVPRVALVAQVAHHLRRVREQVLGHLTAGRLLDAVAAVDDILLRKGLGMTEADLATLRRAHEALVIRRRGRAGGRSLRLPSKALVAAVSR